jgi:hypothetical protein
VLLRDGFPVRRGDAMMLHGGESRFSGFRRDGDEQASGGLRIEQIRNSGGTLGSATQSPVSAVILQAARDGLRGRLPQRREIGEGLMVDFEKGLDAVRRSPSAISRAWPEG